MDRVYRNVLPPLKGDHRFDASRSVKETAREVRDAVMHFHCFCSFCVAVPQLRRRPHRPVPAFRG
jgi:hypothetical protein